MSTRKPKTELDLRTLALTVIIVLAVFVLFLAYNEAHTTSAQTRKRTAPRAGSQRLSRYSAFPHDINAHKMECSSCHKFPSPNWKSVRAEAEAFPDITEYPRHESCLNCHKQQFFKGARPAICSICHVTPSPRGGPRHPFPNPRERFDASPKGKLAVSDFDISFPHATHIDIVSQLRRASSPFQNASFKHGMRAEESCAVCHKTLYPQGDGADEYMTKPPVGLGDDFWLKKGTFKSTPIGHTVCFTCHSADSGLSPAPSDCGTCHKLKQKTPRPDFDAALVSAMGVTDKLILNAWRKRDSSGKFRHEWFSHAELSCSTCHNAEKINTLDPATKRVSINACATCHATATLDDGGALNYEIDQRAKNTGFECVKCHLVFGRLPIPAAHLSAVAAVK